MTDVWGGLIITAVEIRIYNYTQEHTVDEQG